MSSFTFNQCEVVGRSLPTPSYQHPKIYHMNVYPTNEVTEKSKYRCFLRKPNKLKKGSNGHVLVIDKASVIIGGCFRRPIRCLEYNASSSNKSSKPVAMAEGPSMSFHSLVQPLWKIQSLTSQSWLSLRGYGTAKFGECAARLHKVINWKEKFKISFPVLFIRLAVGAMLVVSLSVVVSKTSSWALTEENLIFLEAWRTVDRAYYDKTFNGQSWFRYRENALRNEPMNTREETYTAIKKMLATLDDPFTRFLEPEKFKSLRSGTQGSLTGVGLSIGYPTGVNGSSAGLVVISSSPEGPANRAGIMPGDAILSIDDTSTEMMGLYDAAERLQGPEGTMVELVVRSGPDIKQLTLKREKVTLNPVKLRLCEVPGTGKGSSRIGYIKLTSFNQNASGAVKEAIEALRRNNVSAFVLDLRNNSGGSFPEGIEIAKIWLEKGVIVYICDSRGVRDIYETDGSNVVAASEPLAVLVNKGTASASEILAGALKDNKRAVLFGERTFGKGKIQSVFELSDGSGLAVTVARYETPAHTDIDKVGVMPDHPLPTSFPLDEDGFCSCLKDSASSCSLNNVKLFTRCRKKIQARTNCSATRLVPQKHNRLNFCLSKSITFTSLTNVIWSGYV